MSKSTVKLATSKPVRELDKKIIKCEIKKQLAETGFLLSAPCLQSDSFSVG